ncbi:hypothetical protein [Spirosoma oryzicola]|uniref:hypothetical protein n=1 Tax=Spirosoma oryzicola TaxID=2898794 RepID=UPI001E47E584|nr:hypothetical protein [Spirosoma oryzicola]UHG93352.1 hypothetical protein LQ777_10710 [Spirosoma oryzicola]
MIEIDYTKVICQTSSLRRVHNRTRALNEAMPAKTFTKVINGQEVEYQRKPKAVTGSVEATLERLVKNYIREHHKLLKTVGQPAFDAGLPPLRLSRPQLAMQRTIAEKTAYNHLATLRKLGFITDYKFRGSKHAFEIWIDPTLLFQPERLVDAVTAQPYPQPAVDSSKSSASEPHKIASILAQTANFTAYKASSNQRTKETEINKADECGQGNDQIQQGNENQGNTERPAPNHGQNGRQTEQLPFGNQALGGRPDVARPGLGQRLKARMTKADLDAQAEANRTPDQRQAILHGYVRSFWRYAQQKLYAAKTFTENEERLTLNAIWKGVYNCADNDLTEKQWDAYQAALYQRIDIAAGYYSRNPDKWVPAPYAQLRPGTGYFDQENQRGFIQTDTWYQANKAQQIKLRVTQAINLAIRHLQLHRVGKAPKAIQQKNYIEAYRHLEAKVQKLGPDAHTRFLQIAATLDQQKPHLTPGFTKNFKN